MGYTTSLGSTSRLRWPMFYLAVAFTTLGTLLLELALTRVFSVVFHYHFAFLAISIALFGLGAGALCAYVAARWRRPVFEKLGVFSALNSAAVLGGLVLVLSVRETPGFWTLAAVYLPTTTPFFLAGIVLSTAVAEAIDRVNRVYFSDLAGAAAGCLLFIPLLEAFGGPNTVLAAGVFYAAAAAIWFSLGGSVQGRVVSVALALALTVFLGYNSKVRVVDVRYAKGKKLAGESFVKWNSFSRVALSRDSNLILIDADGSTRVASFDFDQLSDLERKRLLYEGPGLPYLLRPGAKTLVIGAGGGWDVARALAGGSRDVTAVEINPIIARTLMQGRLKEASKGIYLKPEVRVEVAEARAFVSRSRQRYDVIQATLVDTWASTAAGAYTLSENYLYTVEAFRQYLGHLKDTGLLAFTRWGLEPPRESLRLVSLARRALEELGAKEPWRHFVVVRQGKVTDAGGWGALDTVLVSRKPLTASDVGAVEQVAAEAGLQLLYLPGRRIHNAFTGYLLASDPRQFEAQYPYNIRPVGDNNPFFFYTVQKGEIGRYLGLFLRGAEPGSSRADFQVNLAVPVMAGLLGVSVAAVVLILILPPVVLKAHVPSEPGLLGFLVFFLLIGVGYILTEVALIQRFVLFLGHPTYALTVVVFSLLTASGIGSFASRRAIQGSERRLRVALMGASVLLSGLTLGTHELAKIGVGWAQAWKVLLTVAMIAPAGFVMGMALPAGLSLLERYNNSAVKWAWAVNSAASVLGSAAALFVAIYGGLRMALASGAACYMASVLPVLWSRSAGKPEPVCSSLAQERR